jgi:hypothetical protein
VDEQDGSDHAHRGAHTDGCAAGSLFLAVGVGLAPAVVLGAKTLQDAGALCEQDHGGNQWRGEDKAAAHGSFRDGATDVGSGEL